MNAYEVSKAGVNRLTTSVAASNARYGIYPRGAGQRRPSLGGGQGAAL